MVSDRYDVLIVGSGIAGLSFALKSARAGLRVAILTKKTQTESNTNYAQGGIASVTSQTDDVDLHVRDTLEAGDGLCREEVVRQIVRDGPDRVRELGEMGVAFSHLDDGRISLGKEGGHSKRRILHVADVTGKAIEDALLDAIQKESRIAVFEHHFAIDLITRRKLPALRRIAETGVAAQSPSFAESYPVEGGMGSNVTDTADAVAGLYVYDIRDGVVRALGCSAVMLATGGVGQVYQFTTNPDIATGDGIAMASRAGLPIANLEFVQFHPTALYAEDDRRFLVSEAVRGEGAVLRNQAGEAFMSRYHSRADLASRDHVARAIDAEMKRSGARHVWLDITHQEETQLRRRFPAIFAACERHGINMARDWIPVVPAAHYLCGGIPTRMDASTELPGLYACGEVACTGLHGANRLASNSLLEAVVLAHRGAQAVADYIGKAGETQADLPPWVDGDLAEPDERVVLLHNLDELKRTMWDYVGIVRTTKRLERARKRIENLRVEIAEYYWNFKVERGLLELRNLIEVAALIVGCALQRRESRGLHYTLDFPEKSGPPEDSRVEPTQVREGVH